MRLAPSVFLSMLVLAPLCTGCGDDTDDNTTPPATNPVVLKNHSATPALVKNMTTGVEVYSLLGSDDTLAQSPGFIFGGSADGTGVLKNDDGTYTMLVNNEDNFAVSRITLDKTFKPVRGEYVVNSDGARWRLCSATMATPAEHGFGPVFLTCGESGEESMTHAIDPRGGLNQSRPLPALGHWSAENALPLPAVSYPGKTVILIGDDDSGPYGGQMVMYVANSVGDLNNGKLYVLARKDNTTRERAMAAGQSYEVEFREIPNATSMSGAQLNAKSAQLQSIAFGRVEDVDYRKGGAESGREVYFTVTGQAFTGVNADSSRTKYGRIYRLKLDAGDPLKGSLECVLDGDDRNGPAKSFQDPDNICVTQNYVYFVEDPNGYGDETHDAYLYQYNIGSKALAPLFELDHRRGDAKYNVGGDSKKGAWEFAAMVDLSDLIGIPNTFILCVQPHTWTGARYRGVDGGTLRATEEQASQMLVVKGLPR